MCYMHECVHARMCARVVCAFVRDETQDFKQTRCKLSHTHSPASSHSLLGSGHWTLRSPRPLMIKYLVQCLLHPVASSSEGFGSQDAGRQMGAQTLSLLSRLHVWSTDSAQGQCLLWLPPICDFALGTSGVPYPVTGRIKDTAPMGIWVYYKRTPANPYPRGRHPCDSPHRNRRLAQCEWYHVPHTETQPATWELVFIFV